MDKIQLSSFRQILKERKQVPIYKSAQYNPLSYKNRTKIAKKKVQAAAVIFGNRTGNTVEEAFQ